VEFELVELVDSPFVGVFAGEADPPPVGQEKVGLPVEGFLGVATEELVKEGHSYLEEHFYPFSGS